MSIEPLVLEPDAQLGVCRVESELLTVDMDPELRDWYRESGRRECVDEADLRRTLRRFTLGETHP